MDHSARSAKPISPTSPSRLAEAFARLPPLSQTRETENEEVPPANLPNVHLAASAIGRRSQTAPRGSTSPLQRWNSERRQSIQQNATQGLQASRPATQPASPEPNDIAIIITPPKSDPPDDDSSTVGEHHSDSSDDKAVRGNPPPDNPDSDSESRISFDLSETDEEYGKLGHPQMAANTRAALEDLIFAGKDLTTLHYKRLWEVASAEEDQYVKDHRVWKYGHDVAAGSVNQLTSFGLGAIVATAAGNPWLFPVVSAILSDLVGDRLAQLIRRSTIIPTASREHFENHRRMARALGDLIAGCSGKQPKKRFWVETTDALGNKTKVKMTATEALAHTGWQHGLGAFAQNLLVRGLPFMWFAYVYWPRDYYINDYCKPVFFPNATGASATMNSTATAFCPNPEQVDVTSVRWALQIFGGMMAGGMTMLTNQLLSSWLPGNERTTYSTRTWKLQADYLASARRDTKDFLDRLSSGQLDEELGQYEMPEERKQDLVKSARVLDRLQAKELSVAEKKSSLWTTYRGELDQATQKHRDETQITPEFAGRRLDTALSMLGKLLSLLVYAGMVSEFNSRQAAGEDDRLTRIVLLPLYLIVIGGYVWRDDLRLVGHLPYGIFKGCVRACTGEDDSDQDTTDTVVKNPVHEESSGYNPAESREGDKRAAKEEDRNDQADSDGDEAPDSAKESATETSPSDNTRIIDRYTRRRRGQTDSDDDSE